MADKLLSEVRYSNEDYKVYDADAARSNHSHDWTSITDKPSTFTPATHSHDWTSITNKPSTFTPATHTHDYLPLSGGTVTGTVTSSASIIIKDGTIDRDGTAPTADFWSAKALIFQDKNNEQTGYVKPVWKTNGAIDTVIVATSEKSDGTAVSNAFKVGVDKSGNCSYQVSNPANFRTSISSLGVDHAKVTFKGAAKSLEPNATAQWVYQFSATNKGGGDWSIVVPSSGSLDNELTKILNWHYTGLGDFQANSVRCLPIKVHYGARQATMVLRNCGTVTANNIQPELSVIFYQS